MRIEDVIRKVFQGYLDKYIQSESRCVDEEMLALFCEGRLNPTQSRRIEAHLAVCGHCAEIVALYIKAPVTQERSVPPHLIERAKALLQEDGARNILEVALALKEKVLELLNTTGDVIHGDEIMPLPVLRSRGIREFKEEISLIKEFEGIKIALHIEKKEGNKVAINVALSDKATLQPLTDARVALYKDNAELESYLARSGTAVFEGLTLGIYTLEISRRENRIGIIKVEIR